MTDPTQEQVEKLYKIIVDKFDHTPNPWDISHWILSLLLPAVEALIKIKTGKHQPPCSGETTGYMDYCNCTEETAEKAIAKLREAGVIE